LVAFILPTVLVVSYFEWIAEKGQKIPFYIHHDDPEQLIYLAGMYDVWTDSKTNEKRYTCTVVTTESSPQLAHIHVHSKAAAITLATYFVWPCPHALELIPGMA
jgi:putative SOS response-associated peptidase YedK